MNKEKLINEILDSLDDKKYVFLNKVEEEVKSYISKQSIEKCLTIIERNNNGSVYKRWYPEDFAKGYITRLVKFCQKKRHKGRKLDSALTDDVVKIVTNQYEKFYSENSDLMSKKLMKILFSSQIFVNSFTENIRTTSNSPIPSSIKTKIAAILIVGLEENYNISITGTSTKLISEISTKIVTYATSIPIVKTLTTFIVTHFGAQLKAVIIKVLGTAAMKGILAGIIKKIAAAKILTAIIAFVGLKLGIVSGGAVIGFILIPLLVAFIAREVIILPRKLSNKVSSEIRYGLSSEFRQVNFNVVSHIVIETIRSGANGFLSEMINSREFKEGIDKLMKEIK